MSDDIEVMMRRRNSLADPIGRLARMMEIRAVEQSLQDLFNRGEIRGSTHLSNGQEAVSVGIASVLEPTDWVTCTYRGHGLGLALGLTPESVIGEIAGRASGCLGGVGGSMHLAAPEMGLMPTFAIVGAGYPVAVGAALTSQYLGSGSVAVAVCGDGATNIGAFHESLNLAAIWKLPAVFIIENNLYGEYTRIQLSTPIEDLATRADSYGMPSAIVDGQDVDAVISAVSAAVDRARSGGGPTLLEMKTYRFSGHSRADQATYRPPGELDVWLKRDPIDLFADQLVSAGDITADVLGSMRVEIGESVAAASEAAVAGPEPELDQIFAHTYAPSKGGS
jgi:pyruvate dehydrogenase E1 component alpha subunit